MSLDERARGDEKTLRRKYKSKSLNLASFLDMTSKTKGIKLKIDKLDSSNLKSFMFQKTVSRK